MLVRMKVGLSGPDFSLQPGDEREFEAAEAIRLVNAGFAVPLSGLPIETAVAEPADETRAAGARKRRR